MPGCVNDTHHLRRHGRSPSRARCERFAAKSFIAWRSCGRRKATEYKTSQPSRALRRRISPVRVESQPRERSSGCFARSQKALALHQISSFLGPKTVCYGSSPAFAGRRHSLGAIRVSRRKTWAKWLGLGVRSFPMMGIRFCRKAVRYCLYVFFGLSEARTRRSSAMATGLIKCVTKPAALDRARSSSIP